MRERTDARGGGADPRAATRRLRELGLGPGGDGGDDGEDVLLREDQVVLLVDLHLAARVLRVDHPVADLDVQGDALAALLVVAPISPRFAPAFLRLLPAR